MNGKPKTFYLDRVTDATGVSGTGVVAWGTLYPDGRVTIRWNTAVASTVCYDNLDAVTHIHGHGGATVLRWYNDE